MYLHCVQKKTMLNQSRRPIKLLTRLSIGLNVSEVRRSIGLNIVLAHRYELCFTLIGAIHAAALRVTTIYNRVVHCRTHVQC